MTTKMILGIIQLTLAVWVAWAKADGEKKENVKELKKEADDAVESGDIPRLHRIIERIGRM